MIHKHHQNCVDLMHTHILGSLGLPKPPSCVTIDACNAHGLHYSALASVQCRDEETLESSIEMR